MLDLAFVRNNLPLVEEKLRQRGMDPALVLGIFMSSISIAEPPSPKPKP